jgi:hypothetical protein
MGLPVAAGCDRTWTRTQNAECSALDHCATREALPLLFYCNDVLLFFSTCVLCRFVSDNLVYNCSASQSSKVVCCFPGLDWAGALGLEQWNLRPVQWVRVPGLRQQLLVVGLEPSSQGACWDRREEGQALCEGVCLCTLVCLCVGV